MRKVLIASTLLLISSNAISQQLHRCLSYEAVLHETKLDPAYKQRYEETFQQAKRRGQDNFTQKSDVEYTIPVVVHVVYNKPEHNIHDSIIHNQIRVLNEDYGRLNRDSVNLRSEFSPLAGNPKIKFVLASVDPDGNPTTGITRTYTATSTFGSFTMMNDLSGVEKIKKTNDGGIDPWNQTRYLNIWVGNMAVSLGSSEMPIVLGYATPPPNLPHWPAGSTGNLIDGVVVQYQCFGSNNPNPLPMMTTYVAKGRTATHEVGHYLGLRHIWGDSQDCSIDDGVADTPNATSESQQDCDASKNTCTDNIGSHGDLPDMIENFMDYSAETCQNTFTKGQTEIMRGILDGPRYDLVHDNVASSSYENAITASLSPNPSSGFVTASFSVAPEFIHILDAQGRIIQTVNNVGQTLQLDLSGLDAGIYILQLGNYNRSERVIKL